MNRHFVKSWLFFYLMIFHSIYGFSAGMMNEQMTPQYLYKVISIENWNKSQGNENLELSAEDHDFIHFATEDQLKSIIAKYWSHMPVFIVLKVETNKMPGKMVLEANPGGSKAYYHLYDGSIPFNAVVEYIKIDVEKDL